MNTSEIIANTITTLSLISLIVGFIYLQAVAKGTPRLLIIIGGLIAFSPLIIDGFLMFHRDNREAIEVFYRSLRFFGLLLLSIGVIFFSMRHIESNQGKEE